MKEKSSIKLSDLQGNILWVKEFFVKFHLDTLNFRDPQKMKQKTKESQSTLYTSGLPHFDKLCVWKTFEESLFYKTKIKRF